MMKSTKGPMAAPQIAPDPEYDFHMGIAAETVIVRKDAIREPIVNLRDAAEIAYSEMAFAVQDIACGNRTHAEQLDRRAKRLANAADQLRSALDRK